LRVFDHTKRIGYESGPSILQHFGAAICKQAFRLFDSSRFGAIIFRDFCCALSIICLGSSDEKIRFLFDLFDLDRDGFLSRKELVLMF
jgi:Ca2+-binding EF-hand superfamily protein